MTTDTMQSLRAGLENARGRWPEIAGATGVNYFTIARIARSATKNPRLDTVEAILRWLDEHQVQRPAA